MIRLPFNLRNNRAGLAAILIGVFAVALVVLVFWSIRRPGPPMPKPPPAPGPVVVAPPEPLLDRQALIAIAARAASAYGAGEAPPDQSKLVGRSFELSIGFDCGAPDLSWRRDLKQKRIRLSARLQTWTDSTLVAALEPATFDVVEGFWLPRPWISSEACRTTPLPVRAAASAVDHLGRKPDAKTPPAVLLPPPRQTLGLASFYAPGSSRVAQRGGKPYETIQKLDAQLETATSADFSMTVTGRISEATPGRPVVCHAEDPGRRPVCLVAVEIDHVTFVRKGADKPIAEWRQ